MINLMKYEIVATYKWYLMMFVVYLLSCALVPYLPAGAFKDICVDVVLIEMIVLAVGVFVVSIVRFYRSMYTHQGYFTLTLPYKYSTIVCAKITIAALWVLLGFVIIGCGVTILSFTFLANLGLNDFFYKLVISLIRFAFELISTEFWLKALLAMAVELVQFLIVVLLIISVVQTKYTKKYRILIASIIFLVYIFANGLIVANTSVETMLMLTIDYYWLNVVTSLAISTIAYFIIVYIQEKAIELE